MFDVRVLIQDAESRSLIPLCLEESVFQVSLSHSNIIISDSGFTVFSLPLSDTSCQINLPLTLQLTCNFAVYSLEFLTQTDFDQFCHELPPDIVPASQSQSNLTRNHSDDLSFCPSESESDFPVEHAPKWTIKDTKSSLHASPPRPPFGQFPRGSLFAGLFFHQDGEKNFSIKWISFTCSLMNSKLTPVTGHMRLLSLSRIIPTRYSRCFQILHGLMLL
ncbi:hypothetical protein GEMRC1_007821 [Eukaryota sp. GEM-RC1]